MSTRGARLPDIVQEDITSPRMMRIAACVGVVCVGLYVWNLKQDKDHYVSKRGKIANSIGHTRLNEQIGKKNLYANRMKKLFAGGKYEYSKNSTRDLKSSLYRR